MPLMTAADFCDRNAREFGANEALVDRRQRLTWSQVKQLSDRLAASLVKLGLQRDAKILVQLPNCAELFLIRLACEKAGVRLVTVTPTFRLAELAPIIRFTGPKRPLFLEFTGELITSICSKPRARKSCVSSSSSAMKCHRERFLLKRCWLTRR